MTHDVESRPPSAPTGTPLSPHRDDKTARLWDVTSGEEIGVLRGQGEREKFAAFSPDGRTVVTGSSDGTARLWPAGERLIELACAWVPWPLSTEQRQRFGIAEEWCTADSAELGAKLGLDAVPASVGAIAEFGG